jgi:peptidoglycan/xylan/chitin deacetylase (PgdA/CDA1 family)
MYHGIVRSPLKLPDWCFLEEGRFRVHLKYLKKHFEIIPLSEAIRKMKTRTVRCPTAVITFDDGFQNVYEVAFPILHAERIPATIFLATQFVDTDDTLWFCRLNEALAHTSHRLLERNGIRFDLSSVEARAKTAAMLQSQVKSLPNPQLLIAVRKIISDLGGDPDYQTSMDSPFRMLTRQAITEMAAAQLVEIGAHTHSHAILSLLTSHQRRSEIQQSLLAVQDLTKRPCRVFAYPNGRKQDYDQESIKLLERFGVEAAVTTIEGVNDDLTSPMELKRHGVGGDVTMDDFELLVHSGRTATPR